MQQILLLLLLLITHLCCSKHTFNLYLPPFVLFCFFFLHQLLLLWCILWLCCTAVEKCGNFLAFLQRRKKVQFWNAMRVKKAGELIQKCNQTNIFVVHTEKKKQHSYLLSRQSMTCLRACKNKIAFYLHYKRMMRTEVAQYNQRPSVAPSIGNYEYKSSLRANLYTNKVSIGWVDSAYPSSLWANALIMCKINIYLTR